MDTHRINLYCNLTDQVLVETGTHQGVHGFWFCSFSGERRFATADDINARLAPPMKEAPRQVIPTPRPEPAFA